MQVSLSFLLVISMLIQLSSLLWLRVCRMVPGSMWKKPLPSADVVPALTCQVQLDEDEGSRRDFILARPIAVAATTACCVCQIAGFPRILPSVRSFLSAWDATVEMARVHSTFWPACWVECPDRSRRSPSPVVQNIWGVYIQEVGFVPREVREQLFIACNSSDVDASWRIWSWEAEASLARAYLTAGGPALLSPSRYVGRGQLSLRTKRQMSRP